MSTATSSQQGQRVGVGLADFKVSSNPDALLCSLPLGAGLGIILYDPLRKTGGLLHCFLPSSRANPARAAECPAMFIDSGLMAMLAKLLELGAERENLQTYAAGGGELMDDSMLMNIGQKNSESLAGVLEKTGLQLTGQDIGGQSNRSLSIHLGTGEVLVRKTGQNGFHTLCKK